MMQMLRKDKKDEEESILNMYNNLEKTAVLQEAKRFNDTSLNPKKCITILTKILAVLSRGDKLGKNEATDAFFAMTKLFQSKDQNLRRMLYLVIKEMADIADDVIIVTSSLTKDMTGPEIAFRAPAIRALCKITDSTMLQGIERYMKQAIVDKSPQIASAALTSAVHLLSGKRAGVPGLSTPAANTTEVVRRWANEVQEAANAGDRPMVQYHALGLLYLIRRGDKLSVMKMIQKFTRGGLRSSLAQCLMIRIVAKQIEDEGIENNSALLDFLDSALRHKSEIVVYEAARAIVSLSKASAKDLAPAISVLQLFCSNHKSSMRYAAVRTLNHVAMRHPAAVTACNLDLEQLITDSNRSIATLAITTLLKTGNESSVDRLLKQIATFMNEITDEFKIVVVESIRALASKYPRKYAVMVNFLSNLLRNNVGYKFKKAVVNAIESIIVEIPEAKNAGLLNLCEFIEDCEHMKLTVRILHLLGREGPSLKNPRKFIRYIYNRIMLESAPVRCTGTTALARFGAHNEELRGSILVLLQRIMLDEDDEVRDRATYFHALLNEGDRSLMSAYILGEMQVSAPALERALLRYTQNPSAHAQPFDMKQVPIAAVQPAGTAKGLPNEEELAAIRSASAAAGGAARADKSEDRAKGAGASSLSGASLQEKYAAELSAVKQFASFGPLFKSSAPVELTEAEAEYVVRCVKHVFPEHVVLQYEVLNTMENQYLEQVYVAAECEDDIEGIGRIPCPSLGYNARGKCYVYFRLPVDERPDFVSTSFSNTLHFVVKECDGVTTLPEDVDGMNDEYTLEDLSLDLSDHVQRCLKANFSGSWEELSEEEEAQETYSLDKCKTLEETVKLIVDHLGLQPCDRTDKVTPGKSSHQLLLSGVFRGGHEVLVRCKLAQVPGKEGVTAHITVRCADEVVRTLIVDAIG